MNYLSPFRSFHQFLVMTIMALIAIQIGCSKEEMDKMAAKVKDSASELSEKSSDAMEKAKESAKKASATIKEKAGELKDKTSDAMSNLKDSASGLASSAGNLVSMNGSGEMTLDGPTKFPASFVRVVELNETTKVVQLKSYKDGQADSYPSFLLHGGTDGNLGSLNGKTVACQLYAQKTVGGDVWKNVTGQPVAVQFVKQDKTMVATFSGAALVNTANGSQTTADGKFECVNYE